MSVGTATAAPRMVSLRPVHAVLSFVRWPNVLIAAAGVIMGAWWAREDAWTTAPVMWAVAAAMLITAFVNASNDLADVEIDRVAHPRRPLPSGTLGVRAARVIAAVAGVAALMASDAAGGFGLGVLTLCVLLGAAFYSPLLKRNGLAGNLAVAVVASLPFMYGAHAAGRASAGLALVLVAVPLHFARELAKDLDDAAADAAGGRVTLPHRIGTEATRRTIAGATVLHTLLVMFLLVPRAPRGLALAPALLLAGIAARRAGQAAHPGAPLLFKLSMLLAMGGLLALR